MIIAGRGARRAGAGEEVLRLQERTGALLATTLQAKNWLRGETGYHVGISGLFGSKVAMELLQEADCVIAVGASLNSYTIEHGYLFPEAKYIQIDTAPHIVIGNGLAADCYIQADAVTALTELNRDLEERSVKVSGFHTAEVRGRAGGPPGGLLRIQERARPPRPARSDSGD